MPVPLGLMIQLSQGMSPVVKPGNPGVSQAQAAACFFRCVFCLPTRGLIPMLCAIKPMSICLGVSSNVFSPKCRLPMNLEKLI